MWKRDDAVKPAPPGGGPGAAGTGQTANNINTSLPSTVCAAFENLREDGAVKRLVRETYNVESSNRGSAHSVHVAYCVRRCDPTKVERIVHNGREKVSR